MKNVRELALVVDQYVKRKIDVISNPNNYKTKVHQLYDGYRKGKYKHDREAAMDLFGTDESNPSFKKLKQRLEERLINSILLIDQGDNTANPIQKTKWRNNKLLTTCNNLTSLGYSSLTAELVSRGIHQSMKTESTLNEIGFRILEVQRFGIQGGIRKSTKRFEEIISLIDTLKYGVETDKIRLQGLTYILKSGKRDSQIGEYLEHLLTQIRPPKEEDTLLSISSYYSILFKAYLYKNEPNKMLHFASQGESLLRKKDSFSESRLQFIYLHQLMANISLNNYTNAHETANRINALAPVGSNNWYAYINLKSTILIKEKRYIEAHRYIKEALEHPTFQKTIPHNTERIILIRAYIEFYIKLYDLQIESPIQSKFSIARFLNEVPKQSKLKRRENTAILIIHIFLLLVDKRREEAEARIDAIGAYAQRHFKYEENIRSNAFIKIITALPRSRYFPDLFQKKIKKYVKILEDHPTPTITNALDLEINSFENLLSDLVYLINKR